MIKFLQAIKNNNKASILPVTVIAMFIMMIIAYACIKMFLVQNIIITQDQIKARVTYVATGIAQKQIMRLQAAINAKINQDPNVEITADTAFDATGIKNLKKNGTNYNFLFADVLNQTADKDPDVVSGQNFFTADGINGASSIYTDAKLENVIMFPRIKSLGSTIGIPSTALPTDVRKDGGVVFYKSKGVTVTEGNLNYGNLMNINTTIYPIANNSDPRWQNSPDPIRSNPTAYSASFGNSFVEFYTNTGGNYMAAPNINDRQKLFYRIAGTTIDTTKVNTVKTRLETVYPLGVATNWNNKIINDMGACDTYQNLKITAWKVTYLVKNSRQGYYITGKAKSPAISNKIPEITSEVRIYFDLFMTKLYKEYQGLANGTESVWYMNRKNWDINATGSVHTGWRVGNTSTYPLQSSTFFVSDDPNKVINRIKFHIQKWEVVS